MRQGPGIGQGPMNSGGLYICIGLGGGPGLTRGGSLMSKLNSWAVFPCSWAEMVPGLQLNQKSNVPLGSGKEVWVLTQDWRGDSNSQGGMGIVDWDRKTCGNHLRRRWGRSPVQLGLKDWEDNVEGWGAQGGYQHSWKSPSMFQHYSLLVG